MRTIIMCTLGLSALVSLSACTKEDKEGTTPPEGEALTNDTRSSQDTESEPTKPSIKPRTDISSASFVSSSNQLGLDLFKAQAKEAASENIALSPTSISLAFAMTYGGASDETKAQMAKVMRIDSNETYHHSAAALLQSIANAKAPYTLTIANRLFGSTGFEFEPDFLAITNDIYDAPLERVDFAASPERQRLHINGWVEKKTQNRIKELLPTGSIDSLTRLVLANAVYFLGTWESPFMTDRTQEAHFAAPSGTVKAQMMNQTSTFGFSEVPGAMALQMPYKGDRLAMTVLLPNDKRGILAFEASLDASTLSLWIEKASTVKERVAVQLPRFELDDVTLPLKARLIGLGMTRPFDSGQAQFFAMAKPGNKNEELHISDAFHKVFVKVDEKGTEAAAATAVVMSKRGMPPKAKQFVADRPFVFVIHDQESGAILFIGRVADPS